MSDYECTIAVGIGACLASIAFVVNLLHWAVLGWRGRKSTLFLLTGLLKSLAMALGLVQILASVLFLTGHLVAGCLGWAVAMALLAILNIAEIGERMALGPEAAIKP
jgi:hypothetical protein